MDRVSGQYEKLGLTNFFLPNPLPPQNPSLSMDMSLTELYGRAMHALGQLNEMAQRLPNINRFIKAYVVSEALLSSAIEGIHTTRIDVLSSSSQETKPNKETQLVQNYTSALDAALNLVIKDRMPITSRVFLTAHEALMSQGAGESASPGAYRRQSVQVGEFTPPPANKINNLIADMEIFINSDDSLPPLIKAGLIHVQFETIHPFLDGNGRIGRMLIVLMLIESKLLHAPIIYPSYHFKKHHLLYYQKLDLVRTKGDFEGWLVFFLEAIIVSSQDAYRRAKDIEALEKNILDEMISSSIFKNIFEEAKNALSILFETPVISIPDFSKKIGKSYNTANKILTKFTDAKILVEMTSQKRNKVYQFTSYLDLLESEFDS